MGLTEQLRGHDPIVRPSPTCDRDPSRSADVRSRPLEWHQRAIATRREAVPFATAGRVTADMSDNQLLADLCTTIDALAPDLLALQHDLHAHPELSRGETRTTAKVAERLEAAGVAVRRLPVSGLIADLG